MKTSLLAVFLTMSCLLAAPEPGSSKESRIIIGISPFLEEQEKNEVYQKIAGFVLEDAPLGSSIWFYDSYNIKNIAQIDVPDVRAFRSSKTRANQFKAQFGKLRAFLTEQHPKPSQQSLKFDRAIRWPQFMDFVGENLTVSDSTNVVLLMGSPLYMDVKEPSFSMVDGAFPSDGHLLASRAQTVYGLQSRTNLLSGVRVHFCWFGDPWVSELHREKVGRFWSLYLHGQGASLETFCGDLPTMFNAARGRLATVARGMRHELDPSQTKIEMLRAVRDVAVSEWITQDVVANAASSPPTIEVGPMKIGIRWKGNIDLDLYATPAPGQEMLFFEHTRSLEGYYFKDHRSSPEREFEFIEFERPVNVRQVEARINFFDGRASGGPGGEVRIEFGGRIYTGKFTIPAKRGNEGRTGGGQDDYWYAIDVPAILKLQDIAHVQLRR